MSDGTADTNSCKAKSRSVRHAADGMIGEEVGAALVK